MADIDQRNVVPDEFSPDGVVIDPPAQPRGMVSRIAGAAGQGAKSEFFSAIAKPLALAAATPAIVGDKIRSVITGQDDTTAQDFIFKNLAAPAEAKAESYALTPEQAASVPESVAYGLGGLAADLPLIALTGGKAGGVSAAANAGRVAQAVGAAARGATAMVPIATGHAISQAATAANAGVDLPTAYASGATAGATTIAGGVVPLAMRGGLLTRAATGAVSGAATGELGREAQNAVLSDYQNQQTPFSSTGLATQAATGALLGGILGPRGAREVKPAEAPSNTPDLFPQYRDQFMADVNAAREAPVGPEASVVSQYLEGERLGNQLRQEPAVPGEEPPGGRALAAELDVANTLDQLGAQERARQQAIENAQLPSDLPIVDRALLEQRPDLFPQFRDQFMEGVNNARDEAGGRTPVDQYLLDQVRSEPVSDRTNTQLQDALMEARRQKSTQGETRAAFEQVEAERAAAKERELTAIQNISRGEQQVQAAARGEVPAGTETMAAPVKEFQDRLTQSLPEGQKTLPSRLKQEVAQATAGKNTYNEQLDALTALRDKKNQTTVSYAVMDKLVKDLRPEPAPAEPPMQADAAPEAAPENKPVPVRESAQTAADDLDATIVSLNEKARGADLAPNEQARLREAQDLRQTLASVLASKSSSDEYISDLTKFANATKTQKDYDAQGPRLALKSPSPDEPSFGLARVISTTKSVQGVLDYLKDNGSAPWVKDLAGKMADFGINIPIRISNEGLPGEVGRYDFVTREMQIFNGGASEHTALHEVVHTALFDQMDQASKIFAPQNQVEAAKVAALRGLEDVRKEALKRASANDHYGLTNVHEFVAELNTNPKFQEFLSQKSLWQKVVTAVRKLIGLPGEAQTQLEKAMSLQGEFFGKEQYQAAQAARDAVQKFDSTPAAAAKVTDSVLSNIAKTADEDKPAVNLTSMMRKAFQKMLPWETTEYLVDRAHVAPELKASGFADEASKFVRANEVRKLANEYAERSPISFGTDLEHHLAKMKADDARATNRVMSEIGTGSSIAGVDPTRNFADNQKIRPGLAESNKAFVDGLHRKFQQLKAKDKYAAQAIIDGAKVNRKGYVLDQATIISNLMHAAGDNARRLEAELQTMDPNDAATARAQARLQGLTEESRFAIKHAQGLDFMAKDLQSAKNTRPDLHIDGTADTLDQRLRAIITDTQSLPEDSMLRQQIQEFGSAYTNAIDNPYYHAGRNGDFFANVAFRNMDQATWDRMQVAIEKTGKVLGDFSGQDHAFMRFDSLEEAVAAYKKMTAVMGDKFVGENSSQGKLAERLNTSASGVSAAMRSALATLHDNVDAAGLTGEQAAAMKDALTRKFMSMLPETSTRLAQVKRMGVPGYDGDFLGSFSKRAAGGARDTANIYAMRGFTDSFTGMDQAIDHMARTGDPELQTRAQMINDEIKHRYSDSLRPVDGSVVGMINSLGHSFYLALAPAYMIRSMAQPWHRGLPVIGSRYGYVASAKEMAGATGDAMKIMANSIRDGWSEAGLRGALDADLNLDGTNLAADDRAFVQEMHDRGVLKLGQARQLQNMVVGGNLHLRDATRAAAMTIQYSDMVNRLVMGLAAFRLAQKAGGRSVEANTDYALKAVNLAMDNFETTNTARMLGKNGFAGKVTPLFSAFQNFNFQTMQQIARTVHDGMFNRDTSPEGQIRAKEARRELAGLMGTTAMISGAMGLPFVSAFAGVYNALTQDDDNPSDIRLDARNWLADTFGADVGNVLSHGVGYGLGVDTASFGLQDLLPGSQFLADRRLFKDKIADQAKSMWGPSINAGIDIGEGLIKVSDGQFVKGVEQMLPSGLKAAFKAGEIANYGYTDAKGNPLPIQTTPWDVAVQAAGFRPATRALESEAQNYFSVSQARLNARRALITDNYFKGVDRQDADLTQSAMAQIQAFNRANPTQPIRDLGGIIRQKYQERALGAASGTGMPVSRRNLPSLEQDIRFTGNALPRF